MWLNKEVLIGGMVSWPYLFRLASYSPATGPGSSVTIERASTNQMGKGTPWLSAVERSIEQNPLPAYELYGKVAVPRVAIIGNTDQIISSFNFNKKNNFSSYNNALFTFL